MVRLLSLPLLSVVLVAGIIFAPAAPYIAVYLVLGIAILALGLLVPLHWEVLGTAPMKALWIAFGAFVIALPFVFQGAGDFLVFALIAPVLVAPPVAMLLAEEPQIATPRGIGVLCLLAALTATGIAMNDVYVLGLERAGGDNNPIHFGGIALVTGFMSLIGLFGSSTIWRYIFLSGPVMGTFAALLSGSRGPALAAILCALVVLPFLLRWFWRDPAFKIILALLVAILLFVATRVESATILRAGNTLNDIQMTIRNGGSPDPATEQRIVLYQSAIGAFAEAPLFGHGAGQLGSASGKHMPEAFANMRNSEHLHSDIADFAVIGGLMGLLAYASLLLAPLVVARGVQQPQLRRALLLGGTMLSVSYFSLGLTNAMFGILPQTTLFGLFLGILLGMAYIGRTQSGLEPAEAD